MKYQLKFSKLHGLGNDFVVIDAINQRLDRVSLNSLAEALCDRHFGIGADGLILVLQSDHSDLRMRIFNADGSEPEMCGNGIRCFARFAYENKLIHKEVMSVETLAGVIVPSLIIENGEITGVEVDMGCPTDISANEIINVGEADFEITTVSMGNPHAVVFMDSPEDIDIALIGPQFEHHPRFPDRTNTEFARINNRTDATMRVWERGSGETLACGTGACAVGVAGIINGYLDRRSTIHLPGGDLQIEWVEETNRVIMTGPARLVFEGTVEI